MILNVIIAQNRTKDKRKVKKNEICRAYEIRSASEIRPTANEIRCCVLRYRQSRYMRRRHISFAKRISFAVGIFHLPKANFIRRKAHFIQPLPSPKAFPPDSFPAISHYISLRPASLSLTPSQSAATPLSAPDCSFALPPEAGA